MPTIYDARVCSDHTFVLANYHSAKPAKSSPRNTDDVFGRDSYRRMALDALAGAVARADRWNVNSYRNASRPEAPSIFGWIASRVALARRVR